MSPREEVPYEFQGVVAVPDMPELQEYEDDPRFAGKIDVQVLRLAARIAAEETRRLFRPDVALGQEAVTGAGFLVNERTIDVAAESGNTIPLGGPLRCLVVKSGGHEDHSFTLTSYRGDARSVAAVPGFYYRDIPLQGVELVVGIEHSGNIVVSWSEVPDAFGPPCCEPPAWEPFDQSVNAAGDAQANINLSAGFDYEITSVHLVLVTDANVFARQPIIDVRDQGGASIVRYGSIQDCDASEALNFALVAGGAGGVEQGPLASENWGQVGMGVYRVRMLVGAGTQFRGTIEAGQAGDVQTLSILGQRRRF